MENIIEVILTLVFGFFWLFGGALFKRRENDESQQPASPQRSRTSESDQDADSESRQQDIREMIRRKIAERRQQSDSGPVIVVSESEPQYRQQYESVEPQRRVDASVDSAQSPQEAVDEIVSWNAGNNAYEQEMEARLQEIEATKRKAEALKKKIKQVKQDQHGSSQGDHTSQEGALLFGSVQSALKNPRAVRAAFIYSEILGKPISLRNLSENGFWV